MDAEGDATVFDLNGNLLSFESGRIEEEAVSETEKLYKKGADNQFYFFITEEGYRALKESGYEALWEANA